MAEYEMEKNSVALHVIQTCLSYWVMCKLVRKPESRFPQAAFWRRTNKDIELAKREAVRLKESLQQAGILPRWLAITWLLKVVCVRLVLWLRRPLSNSKTSSCLLKHCMTTPYKTHANLWLAACHGGNTALAILIQCNSLCRRGM